LKVVRDRALDDRDDYDDYGDRDGHNKERRRERRSGVVPAWLNLRGRILEGFCAVERERHHDDRGDRGSAPSTLK
jgi:hypothetical protein